VSKRSKTKHLWRNLSDEDVHLSCATHAIVFDDGDQRQKASDGQRCKMTPHPHAAAAGRHDKIYLVAYVPLEQGS
jgi:hypothetical protein